MIKKYECEGILPTNYYDKLIHVELKVPYE